MDLEELIEDFANDWELRGLCAKTINEYERYIRRCVAAGDQFDLKHVRDWLGRIESQSVQRQAARSIRCFGKYIESRGVVEVDWWRNVPLPIERVAPQPTVRNELVAIARSRCKSLRDLALIEMLWATGLRRSELADLQIQDLDENLRSILVRQTKSRSPRRVPISPIASSVLALYVGSRRDGSLFGLSSAGIGAVLKRLDLPPAHAWRRGWAVEALRCGISEASVRRTAGWKSGAMVVRYTAALAEELALAEFEAVWLSESRN